MLPDEAGQAPHAQSAALLIKLAPGKLHFSGRRSRIRWLLTVVEERFSGHFSSLRDFRIVLIYFY